MDKRIIALLLAAVITVMLAACGGTEIINPSSVDTGTVESAVIDDVKTEDVEDAASTDTNTTVSTESKQETTSTESKQETTSTESKQETASTESKQATTSKDQTNSQTTSKPNTTGSSVTGSSTTSNSGNATNQSGQDNITAAMDLGKFDKIIKKGNSVLDGLDFGGKTFTMAITAEGQYHTDSFLRTVTTFEKKFNCKIKFETLVFDSYNQQVAQRLASGKAPDICFVHGVNFPACAIDGMYNPLNDVIKTGDIMDSKNPAKGGIDLNKTSYFVYKGEIYGTCNYSSCFPYIIYYNKKQMADEGFSGNKDLRNIAEHSANWTWEFIKALGKKLTKGDKYFLSNSFTGRGLPLSFGASITTVKNGKYKENVSSTAFFEAMKLLQSLTYGSNAIIEPRDSAHAYNSYQTLLKGKVFLWTEESSKYLDIAKDVNSSTTFDRDKNNIGITTLPLGSTNTAKAYPTGWLTAVASGKGTDPRVALAWDVFRSGYDDPVKGSNEMSDEDQAFVDGLIKGNICCENGSFGTSTNTTINLTESGIVSKIVNGADVAQCITSTKEQITVCIAQTMKE